MPIETYRCPKVYDLQEFLEYAAWLAAYDCLDQEVLEDIGSNVVVEMVNLIADENTEEEEDEPEDSDSVDSRSGNLEVVAKELLDKIEQGKIEVVTKEYSLRKVTPDTEPAIISD